MKVLLINGSPNREGCTYVALKQIQETFSKENIDSEIYRIGHKDIRGCIDCRKCSELGKCVFDDEVNSFVEKLRNLTDTSSEGQCTMEQSIQHLQTS